MTTKRTPTIQAQAATAIRKMLKQHGIKARVRSSSASMMTAVDVTIYDELPATFEAVTAACNRHQYGHFDGMQDLYEYSNRDDTIPQVKFVNVTNEFSDSMKAWAWAFCRDYYGFACGEKIEPDPYSYDDRDMLWRMMTDKDSAWNTLRKPRQRAA